MTTEIQHRTNPIADLLHWFETGPGAELAAAGLSARVRIEDFVDDDTYVVRAEMPGIDPDKDLHVSLDGDVLTIRGERREEQKDRHRHEFHYGSFARSVVLPRSPRSTEVSANYTDGVLEVRVPLAEARVEARRIPVQRRKE